MAEVNGEAINITKLNGIDNDKGFQAARMKLENSEEVDDEREENEDDEGPDSSPSDYEFSLREENIRLKSRLEQAKESVVVLERQNKHSKEQLEKEKKFGDKANKTIYSLMQEKQVLEEKLKRAGPINSVHHDGIQEVVRKLEHEIQVLEERLDDQRQRYHQEHLLMYDDLKEERIKRQEWKKTYLKSQVAVMAFRRKLSGMSDRVSEEDIKELSKCLELVFHEQDGRLKKDLLLKSEESCIESSSKYTAHINNTYKTPKDLVKSSMKDSLFSNKAHSPSNSENSVKIDDTIRSYKLPLLDGDSNNSNLLLHKHPHSDEDPNDGTRLSHKHSHSVGDDGSHPKVFIMDDEDKLVDPANDDLSQPDINVKLPPLAKSNNFNSYFNQRYELDGNKHHHHSFRSSIDHQLTQDHSPLYKHWHHYSVDKPGHNLSHNHKLDGLDIDSLTSGISKSLVRIFPKPPENKLQKSRILKFNSSYKDRFDLSVNDAKSLDVNFDKTFLKNDHKSVPQKEIKHVLKSSLRNEVGTRKIPGKVLDEKKLWCLVCDQEVPDKSCGHMNIIVQEKEKEFPCPTCHRIFNNKSHLKRHNMIHSGEKPWACTYCDKRFNRKSHLNRHLLTHTGEKPFKCPYCIKGFADNSDLKRHKMTHETSTDMLTTSKTDATPITSGCSATVENTLDVFVNLGTTNVTSANSEVSSTPSASSSITNIVSSMDLNTTFSVSSNVNTCHTSVVSNNTFPSSVDSGATFMASMTSAISSNKKLVWHSCNKCGKQFSRRSHLARHKLTHDQIKIYCDCGRLFRQSSHLQAHLPACVRKRKAAENRYNALHGIRHVNKKPPHGNNTPPSPLMNTEKMSLCSYSQSIDTGRNKSDFNQLNYADVQSVNDNNVQLDAKFNDEKKLCDPITAEEKVSKNEVVDEPQGGVIASNVQASFNPKFSQSSILDQNLNADISDRNSPNNTSSKDNLVKMEPVEINYDEDLKLSNLDNKDNNLLKLSFEDDLSSSQNSNSPDQYIAENASNQNLPEQLTTTQNVNLHNQYVGKHAVEHLSPTQNLSSSDLIAAKNSLQQRFVESPQMTQKLNLVNQFIAKDSSQVKLPENSTENIHIPNQYIGKNTPKIILSNHRSTTRDSNSSEKVIVKNVELNFPKHLTSQNQYSVNNSLGGSVTEHTAHISSDRYSVSSTPKQSIPEQNSQNMNSPREYISKQKLIVCKSEENLGHNQNDIKCNSLAKNGTCQEIKNDDLKLEVDTLPSLPAEFPPLFHEPLDP